MFRAYSRVEWRSEPCKNLSAANATTALWRGANVEMTIQIFGVKNSQATRAAERYFKERRVAVQFVDLTQKAMAPGEIRRFVERFGLPGLLDVESKAYVDGGLKYLKLSDTDLIARIERDPKLLRLPLVRSAKVISVGQDEEAWKAMVSAQPSTAKSSAKS
jgi:arsenate reductase